MKVVLDKGFVEPAKSGQSIEKQPVSGNCWPTSRHTRKSSMSSSTCARAPQGTRRDICTVPAPTRLARFANTGRPADGLAADRPGPPRTGRASDVSRRSRGRHLGTPGHRGRPRRRPLARPKPRRRADPHSGGRRPRPTVVLLDRLKTDPESSWSDYGNRPIVSASGGVLI